MAKLNMQFIRVTNGSGVRFSGCFSATVMRRAGDESGDELLLRCMNSLRQSEHHLKGKHGIRIFLLERQGRSPVALFRLKGGLPIEEGPFYNDKLTDCRKTVCFSFHPNI